MPTGIQGKQKRKLNRFVYDRDNGRCHYCGREVRFHGVSGNPPDDQATLDHIIPKGLGGDNGRHNFVLACQDCNQRRGMMPYADFKARIRAGRAA